MDMQPQNSGGKRECDRHAVEILIPDGLTAEEVTRRVYNGALALYCPRPAGLALCEFAQGLVEEAFHAVSPDLEPQTAQHELSVDDFVEIVAPLKPRFIHHPETRVLLKKYYEELGFDPETTYIDVPRMRVVTSEGYLQSGVGHKQPPHRDTWWSAPAQQIQFWSPLYPMSRECSMEFYPHYQDTAIANTSGDFNIYRWNATGRKNAAQHRHGEDKRGIPQPTVPMEHPASAQIVLPVGGSVLFSADQLHATTDNTTGKTRFSIDFRVVNVEHCRNRIGAAMPDNASTGIALRDFKRMSDDAPFPEDVIAMYDSGEGAEEGALVFQPD